MRRSDRAERRTQGETMKGKSVTVSLLVGDMSTVSARHCHGTADFTLLAVGRALRRQPGSPSSWTYLYVTHCYFSLVCVLIHEIGSAASICAHLQMWKKIIPEQTGCAGLFVCVHTHVCQCVYVCVCQWVSQYVPDAHRASETQRQAGSAGNSLAPGARHFAGALFRPVTPRALELTSGGYQSDKEAEQYHTSVCSFQILC